MNGGWIVLHRQSRILRSFEESGATEPARARMLDELGLRESFVFRGLVRRGVIVETPGGRYHLDPAGAAVLRSQRRLVLFVALAVVAVVIAALALSR